MVIQISNHGLAKTQAEIQQTVQPVFNMEKGRKFEVMMMMSLYDALGN